MIALNCRFYVFSIELLLILRRYFKDYHSILPILDPSVTPNTFYQHTPFLFWVVVSIGSRRYTRQPSLTRALALPVTQLALQSIVVRTEPTERIKALILLLDWPFPTGSFSHDPSFLFSGTLLHLAMQCGLHVPSFSQDFSETYLGLPDQELIRRTELWAYFVITYKGTLIHPKLKSIGIIANLIPGRAPVAGKQS
jgi:transcriptional regulatory protein LEU3